MMVINEIEQVNSALNLYPPRSQISRYADVIREMLLEKTVLAAVVYVYHVCFL